MQDSSGSSYANEASNGAVIPPRLAGNLGRNSRRPIRTRYRRDLIVGKHYIRAHEYATIYEQSYDFYDISRNGTLGAHSIEQILNRGDSAMGRFIVGDRT
jgi:hypothetical protein